MNSIKTDVCVDNNKAKFKIAYWLNKKKNLRLNLDKLSLLLNEQGYELIAIEQESDFENKGPFAVIFHKSTDLIAKKQEGELSGIRFFDKFNEYTKKYPWTKIIDPIENVSIIIDRYKQYKVIAESELAISDKIFTPNFVELTSKNKTENIQRLKEANVKYPFISKPIVGHGSSSAHQMTLVFCEDGLDEINPPCVAQSFINHSAKLYKLFIIKDKFTVIERPSLKNFQPGNFPNISFNTYDVSKTNSSCELNRLNEEDEKLVTKQELKHSDLNRIVNVLGKCFKLDLLGIDLIIEDGTGRYAIIDINNFPGYDGIDNIIDLFKDLLINKAEEALLEFNKYKKYHQNEISLTNENDKQNKFSNQLTCREISNQNDLSEFNKTETYPNNTSLIEWGLQISKNMNIFGFNFEADQVKEKKIINNFTKK